MAEIKSAIELAMERTKNLVMDEKEKHEFARKELEEKLRAILRRYVEGLVEEDGFLIEYSGVAGEAVAKRGVLIDLTVEEFSLSEGNERLFDIFELLGKDLGLDAQAEAHSLRKQFHEELGGRKAHVKAQIGERLKGIGISGSAMEPNLEAWDEWKDAVQEIRNRFVDRLHEWKDRIGSRPA
jgi:hypothetical protein